MRGSFPLGDAGRREHAEYSLAVSVNGGVYGRGGERRDSSDFNREEDHEELPKERGGIREGIIAMDTNSDGVVMESDCGRGLKDHGPRQRSRGASMKVIRDRVCSAAKGGIREDCCGLEEVLVLLEVKGAGKLA